MARIDWDRGKRQKPAENGFMDSLAKRAARAERSWEKQQTRAPRAQAIAPPSSTGRVDIAKAALAGAKTALVHSDGGCEPNPGRGGWGITIDVAGLETICLWGGVPDTTNNRMEMTAAIVALSVLPHACAVTIFSDSQYLIKGMTTWLAGWKRKGYRKGDGTIPNADLWKTLDALSTGRSVRWEWVRGHNGHAGNERADGLATRGMREARCQK